MKISVSSNFIGLLISFPHVQNQLMSWIGVRVSRGIYDTFLTGQAIRFKNFRDRRGKKKVSFSKKSAGVIAVSSYPLNLHERSYNRRGGVVVGRGILTKKAVPLAREIAEKTAQAKMEIIAREANSRDKN